MSAQKNISILLADDDEDDCLLFEEAIQELPLATTLVIVHNGKQLMDALNKTQELPDVLFMDLTMPVKDGFECMSEIRNNDALRHLPVVILSTHSDQNIISQVYKAGADHYVRKPDDLTELERLIRKSITLILNLQDDLKFN